MIDAHTHTHFSFDGKAKAEDMAKRGEELSMEYMAFTDHYDLDYSKILRYKYVHLLNMEKYLDTVEEMKSRYPFLALGIECGYSELCQEDYKNTLPYDRLDYVLNSIHTICGLDCWNPEYFTEYERKEAFVKYLVKVLESVNCGYQYDTITHLGFVRKNCPYDDRSMSIKEFGDYYDEILKGIIRQGKTLEINSNIRSKDFMPTAEVLKRYRELNGENITFASDAHLVARVGEMYGEAAEMAKSLGFKYWTVYRNRKPIKLEIK